MTYSIVEAPADSDVEAYQPFGAVADLWLCKAHECILAGPAETGKTHGALEKLNLLLWKYPKAQAVMVRKQYSDMPGSCIQTWEKKVLGDSLGEKGPITSYGGEKPQFYDYPNGSRLWIGGLDKPGKVLSSERDFIYVNQAEELQLEDWETLTTRATGRAGNAPYSQILGDCNPGSRTHWILERANEGKLTLLHSRHEDNPTLFDPATGAITERGKITLAILDNLTGLRHSRLRLGQWVSAEGQIYTDYDPAVHLIDPIPIGGDWRRFRVIDFGLARPLVCNWYTVDPDGRMYLYRQIYMTGRTVATHSRQIKSLSEGERIEQTICDHDAEDRQTLAENGIPNIGAEKDVLWGIGKVQDRLKKQSDGRPRLFIFKNSLVEVDQSLKLEHRPYATEQEFDGYIWADTQREQPVKADDHGMDNIRYACAYADDGRKPPIVFNYGHEQQGGKRYASREY
jgi:phage terminase large subunit